MAIGKNIKGITIEFDGDTSKLGKAIGDIDKKTRSLDGQLRQVDKALKFNPGNTELVAQKQQLLGQKVSETKNRLEALKAAQAKLDDDPAVDKTSQDYMELRREIIETESKLTHFEDQLKELNNIKFEKIGKQVQDVGGKMKTVGDGMTKYVTAPIVAGGAASVKAWQEVDEGLDIVTQKTGASGKALEAMQQSVKNLTQEIPTDFATAGAAVGEVNTRFGLTGKALEDLSGKFIKFAQLNDTDVSSSIDTVQKAMNAYGLSADEARGFLDVLNKVGQDTGVGMDQLSQAMVTNAASLQQMGFDATQSAFFLGELEKSSVDSQKAMVGMNKALVYSAKVGEPLPEILGRFQEAAQGGASSADTLAMASEIFGSKAGPQLAQAAMDGSLNFDALAQSATDAAGSLEKTFDETQDPADEFTKMLNSLKLTGYEIANSMFTLLAPALEKVAGVLQNLATKWQSLSPGTQEMILKIAGLVAVIGPLLSVFGRLTIGLGRFIEYGPKVIGAFKGIAGAFKGVSGLMAGFNPIVLAVIAGIAALIAIGVLLYKNWDKVKAVAVTVKNAVVSAFTKMKDTLVSVFKALFSVLTWPFRKAWEIIKKVAEKIKGVFNFKFKLPKIKLPHFTVSPKGWKLSDLLHGSIPSLGIDWYAKGAIFTKPTIIGNKGFGERGAEAALPLSVLWKEMDGMFMRMADSIVNGMSMSMALQSAGMGGEIHIDNYLYPNGPKMGEETVRMYDQYKKILG